MNVVADHVAQSVGPVVNRWLEPANFTPEEMSVLAALSCLYGDDEKFTQQDLEPLLEVMGVRLTARMIGKFEQFRVFGIIDVSPSRTIWVRQHHWWHYVRWYFKTGAPQEFKAVNQLLLDTANKEAAHGRDFRVMARQVIYTMRLGHTVSAATIMDQMKNHPSVQMRQQFWVDVMSDTP